MRSKPYRVLSVDDVPAQRYATSRILRNAGYEVVEAEDGTTALSLVASGTFDAFVLDVDLPDIDGVELASRLRKLPQGRMAPIILLSAVFTREDEVRQGLRGGADAYMSLPLNPAQMEKILGQLLSKSKPAERE